MADIGAHCGISNQSVLYSAALAVVAFLQPLNDCWYLGSGVPEG